MNDPAHPTFGNGKICYIEIPAIDIPQSSAFYQKVFGWNIRKDNAGHVSFDDTVGEVSGTWVPGRKASVEPGLLVSIMVNSVADTLKLVVDHGGKIIKSPDTNAREIIGLFSDPAGNVFSLYQHSH